MARMRTIDQAAAWIREQDPETALTPTALRRLVTSGQVPSVRVGQKFLVELGEVEAYLRGSVPTPASALPGIREVRL